MGLELEVRCDCFPLARPFRIARGVRTESPLVVVVLTDTSGLRGWGEGAPVERYGESAESCAERLRALRDAVADQRVNRHSLRQRLAPGPARNALDCAFWHLTAQQAGCRVADLCGIREATTLRTAETISLDTSAAMARQAAAINGAGRLLKVKLDGDGIAERLSAVRNAAPRAELIVDANEAWTAGQVADHMPLLADYRVRLLEQPVPVGRDQELADIRHEVPLGADESCHTRADLDALAGCYDVINIKLDKTGGLTEALALSKEARRRGFGVMVGCMICSSLSIAPAALVAADALLADLDGPTWLARDRAGGFTYRNGTLDARAPLWG